MSPICNAPFQAFCNGLTGLPAKAMKRLTNSAMPIGESSNGRFDEFRLSRCNHTTSFVTRSPEKAGKGQCSAAICNTRFLTPLSPSLYVGVMK